jgi:hypothetical protein
MSHSSFQQFLRSKFASKLFILRMILWGSIYVYILLSYFKLSFQKLMFLNHSKSSVSFSSKSTHEEAASVFGPQFTTQFGFSTTGGSGSKHIAKNDNFVEFGSTFNQSNISLLFRGTLRKLRGAAAPFAFPLSDTGFNTISNRNSPHF